MMRRKKADKTAAHKKVCSHGAVQIPNAALYRADWSPRPVAEVWRQLTQQQWHTSEEGQTDASGTFAARGFLGDYILTIQSPQKWHTENIQIVRGGKTLEITLK